MTRQKFVNLHHIPYGHTWKIPVKRFAVGGEGSGGAGRAVAGAEHIGADREPTVGIQEFPLLHRMRPPVSHIGIRRQCVHHPHDIGFIGIQLSIRMVGHP